MLSTRLVSLRLLNQNKEIDNELLIAFYDDNDLIKRMNTAYHRGALLFIQSLFMSPWMNGFQLNN